MAFTGWTDGPDAPSCVKRPGALASLNDLSREMMAGLPLHREHRFEELAVCSSRQLLAPQLKPLFGTHIGR
jgi:hypothetical protein